MMVLVPIHEEVWHTAVKQFSYIAVKVTWLRRQARGDASGCR
jgi:hypothetical protein